MKCSKCNWKLLYIPPSISFSHCGTDYWTRYGERRFKPTICMGCRSKIGKKARQTQLNTQNQSKAQ